MVDTINIEEKQLKVLKNYAKTRYFLLVYHFCESPKNYVQVLPSRAKITQKKVKYGICNVYFSNTELNIKIRQWIDLIATKMGFIH